ncbi:restriction system protein [Deinobacterium chartae]|uniref:Restriction system protein n=1 Tax=Deinobacterium chartae TaxID=521158 RepID=A0A841HXH3_9DEIO|nr:restriction system protein [Deinobacterium chartae]
MLQYAADGQEKNLREMYDDVAAALQLTDEDRRQLLPSRKQLTYHNRAGWAKTYLLKAGLVENAGRGRYRITETGRQVLAQRPERLTRRDLMRYGDFVAFVGAVPPDSGPPETIPAEEATPDDTLERLHQTLRDQLAQDLLEAVRSAAPAFFEQLVVDLLVAMGYGGTVRDAGRAIGRSGDGGIDGIIKQDRLGLENIYVQAKRWSGNVGSPEVRNFAGSLQYHKATRGVLITTSDFSQGARETARHLGGTLLVSGEELAQLMIDHGVGVTTAVVYEVKRLDRDYFERD